MTWLQDGDKLSLFTNRDELRTRRPALPPQRHRRDSCRYLAPVDGDSGGTWVAVNEIGLALCLLNDYRSTPADPDADFVSRGLLVTELANAKQLADVERQISAVEMARYKPFRLLALEPGQEPRLLSWNGREMRIERKDAKMPLCSSSFDDFGAARARKALLESYLAKTDLEPDKRLLRFHQSHLPERGPYSVCMHRPDAVTVSFTLVEVEPERVSMAYAAGAPCSAPLENLVTLDRKYGDS